MSSILNLLLSLAYLRPLPREVLIIICQYMIPPDCQMCTSNLPIRTASHDHDDGSWRICLTHTQTCIVCSEPVCIQYDCGVSCQYNRRSQHPECSCDGYAVTMHQTCSKRCAECNIYMCSQITRPHPLTPSSFYCPLCVKLK